MGGMTYEASNARRVARPLTGLGLAVTAAVLDMELEAGVVSDQQTLQLLVGAHVDLVDCAEDDVVHVDPKDVSTVFFQVSEPGRRPGVRPLNTATGER